MSVDQESAEIAAGARVKEFLEDEVIKGVFVELERRHFHEFKGADSDEKRLAIWAKMTALESIAASMKGVYDRGTLAARTRQQRQQAEERQASRTQRGAR